MTLLRTLGSGAMRPKAPIFSSDGSILRPRPAFDASSGRVSELFVSSECRTTAPGVIEEISALAALFYLALFRTTRDLLAPFVASNPTWIRLRVDPAERLHVGFGALAKRLRANVLALQRGDKSQRVSGAFEAAAGFDWQLLKDASAGSSVSAVLTSPPYCTRIDHAVATLPELAVVLGYDWSHVQALRAQLIGTHNRR